MTGFAPTLVLVAHGSGEAGAQDAMRAVYAAVAPRRASVPVMLAYLDHAEPRLSVLLTNLPPGPVVLVPFLLADAFHVRVDIAGAATAAEAAGRPVAVADVLAPDPRLLAAVASLLAAALTPTDGPVVLVAAGTTDEAANSVVRDIAEQASILRSAPVIAAFAAAAAPTLAEALATIGDPARATVVPWVLTPGRFANTIAAAARTAGAGVTDVLGSHPALVEIVWDRYDAAAAALSRRNAS